MVSKDGIHKINSIILNVIYLLGQCQQRKYHNWLILNEQYLFLNTAFPCI